MNRTAWLRGYIDAAPGFLARQKKNLGHARYGWNHPTQVSFVFGCQRSGTKMLMRILDRSPAIRIYHENHGSAFHDFQLRSDVVLRALLRLSPSPAQIFKPICDSQNADLILERFPAARALWMYRHYNDVANSALQKWGEHQLEVIRDVARGDLETWGWRTARIPPEIVAEVRSVYRDDLSVAEGALLFWYLRNSFFFSLKLDTHPRMRLAKYERLVSDPGRHFPAIFEQVGAPFDPAFVERVHAESVGRKAPPEVHPAVRALCEGLLSRLDAWTPTETVVSPVLILINTLGVGGAERYAVTVANWLAERGADVTIAASGGGLVQELAPRVKFVETPLRRVRADFPAATKQVYDRIAEVKPAAILCNSLAMTLLARAAHPARTVPIVNVAHGWPVEKYRVVGRLIGTADRVVAVSPDVKSKLTAAGLSERRCVVIQNGVNTEGLGRRTGTIRDETRASLNAGPDHVLVVTVGRLTPQKAHHHVLTIAAALRSTDPSLRYAIVGEGLRADELRALAQEQGVGHLVCFPGLRADVPDILGSADIYLSCSDWEGMPLSTIEAMASGLPTVATQTEGSGQLLDSQSGTVVPIGDVDAMSRAIATLASDSGLRQAMGQHAAARARERFGHDRMVGELASLLAGLIRPSA